MSIIHKELYPNSHLKVEDFNTLFMVMVIKLALPHSHCSLLLEFIRLILPIDNNLPDSYYKIKNLNFKTNVSQFALCKICEVVLDKNKKCPSETCSSHRIIIKKNIKVLCSNISNQLITILSLHYKSMLNYIGN